MSQLLLRAGLHVDQPKVLMLNLSSQKHECPSFAQKGQVPSSASQSKGWQRTRYGLGRDGFHRKRRTDVGPRVDNKAPIGRPYGIHRVFLDQQRGSATVDRHVEEAWNTVIIGRHRD